MPKQVLLIDDEAAILLAYKKLLQNPALRIDTAASVEEAVGCIKKNSYDIVISDVRLTGTTGMEGFDILQLVKAQNPDTGVILITAYGGPDIKKRAFGMGASVYLEKPILAQDLRQAMEELGIKL